MHFYIYSKPFTVSASEQKALSSVHSKVSLSLVSFIGPSQSEWEDTETVFLLLLLFLYKSMIKGFVRLCKKSEAHIAAFHSPQIPHCNVTPGRKELVCYRIHWRHIGVLPHLLPLFSMAKSFMRRHMGWVWKSQVSGAEGV